MNVNHVPPAGGRVTSHPTTPDSVRLDHDVDAYRTQRRRQLNELNRRNNARQVRTETDVIVHFARIWAPYGGAPTEEVFQTFGISRQQFNDKLWQTVEGVEFDASIVRELARVYTRQHP